MAPHPCSYCPGNPTVGPRVPYDSSAYVLPDEGSLTIVPEQRSRKVDGLYEDSPKHTYLKELVESLGHSSHHSNRGKPVFSFTSRL